MNGIGFVSLWVMNDTVFDKRNWNAMVCELEYELPKGDMFIEKNVYEKRLIVS